MSTSDVLFRDLPPRARPTLEPMLAPLARRMRRASLRTSMFIIGVQVFCVAFMFILATRDDAPADDIEWATKLSVLGMIYMGLLPAYAIRRLMLRDVKIGARILRDGTPYHATIIHDGDLGFGPRFITVAWDMDGARAQAVLNGPRTLQHEPPRVEDTVVVVAPKAKYIGVVLGENGLFLATRADGRKARGLIAL